MNQKLPISRARAFAAAAILTVLMVLQSGTVTEDGFQIYYNRLVVFSANYFTWALGLSFLYKFTSKLRPIKEYNLQSVLIMLGWALLIVLIQLLISNFLFYTITFKSSPFDLQGSLENFLAVAPRAYASRLIDLIVIVGILKGLSNYKQLNEQKLAVSELESMLTQTRLEALKMQLNPHFLFNALHAIHSIIGHDNDKARVMIMKISNLLRRILELGDRQLIPLNEELSYLKDYLDVEQERFYDRLEVKYEIEEDVINNLVPSLILQPLAENALKHGISPMEDSGEIVLTVSKNGDVLELKMENSFDPDVNLTNPSLGIGLSNLKNRLMQLYQDQFHIETVAKENRYIICIQIPIQDEH